MLYGIGVGQISSICQYNVIYRIAVTAAVVKICRVWVSKNSVIYFCHFVTNKCTVCHSLTEEVVYSFFFSAFMRSHYTKCSKWIWNIENTRILWNFRVVISGKNFDLFDFFDIRKRTFFFHFFKIAIFWRFCLWILNFIFNWNVGVASMIVLTKGRSSLSTPISNIFQN